MVVVGGGQAPLPNPYSKPFLLSPDQLQPLDETVLQQKPNINAVATLEKVIEIQSVWGTGGGAQTLPRGWSLWVLQG